MLSIGALGVWALNGGLGNLGIGCNNNNNYNGAPSVFTVLEKECADNLALTSAFYNGRITQMNERFEDRQTIDKELFGLYKSQTDADFNLYKNQRDNFDVLFNKISNLETQVAVGNAVRPYQDKLIQCEIADARKDASYDLSRRTCRMITGDLVLPSTPTVTGFSSRSNNCGGCGFANASVRDVA